MAKNMYARLAEARAKLHGMQLTKSGWNNYSRYKYFELADFIIPAMECLKEAGLVPVITYTENEAIMTVYDAEGDGYFVITSPMAKARYTTKDGDGSTVEITQGANLKASHPIQNSGAVLTYQRRYLWITLMEILEHDAIDSSPGTEDAPDKSEEKPAASRKKPLPKKALPKKPVKDDEAVEQVSADEETVIETGEDAAEVVDLIIQFAEGTENNTLENLTTMWKRNKKVIDLLDQSFPDEYERLKVAFTQIRNSLNEDQNDE